jgi:hypothetical protein
MSPTPEPLSDELVEALHTWAFNVMLECNGRQDTTILMGGAIVDLRDLQSILEWALDSQPGGRPSHG